MVKLLNNFQQPCFKRKLNTEICALNLTGLVSLQDGEQMLHISKLLPETFKITFFLKSHNVGNCLLYWNLMNLVCSKLTSPVHD